MMINKFEIGVYNKKTQMTIEYQNEIKELIKRAKLKDAIELTSKLVEGTEYEKLIIILMSSFSTLNSNELSLSFEQKNIIQNRITQKLLDVIELHENIRKESDLMKDDGLRINLTNNQLFDFINFYAKSLRSQVVLEFVKGFMSNKEEQYKTNFITGSFLYFNVYRVLIQTRNEVDKINFYYNGYKLVEIFERHFPDIEFKKSMFSLEEFMKSDNRTFMEKIDLIDAFIRNKQEELKMIIRKEV